MKHCPKGNHDVMEEDYGNQVYCRACWRTYNNDRKKARRIARRQSDIDALRSLSTGEPGLTNNQKKRLEALGRLCELETDCPTCNLSVKALCPGSKQ